MIGRFHYFGWGGGDFPGLPRHSRGREFWSMEKEYIDRAKAIRQNILQLRDSL
jgi:hypothetical protein